MKGYVCKVVDSDFKSKLSKLRKEIIEFCSKEKTEVIVFEKLRWWGETKYTINIPSHLQRYVEGYVLDESAFNFGWNDNAVLLFDLFHLTKSEDSVYLGEELIREYNYLLERFKGEDE